MLSNPKLYLAKPDRTIIADLSNEAYEIKYNSKLSSVSELNFKIPYDIDVGHQLIYNEHIDMILYKYLIKFETESETLWFIIQKPTSDMNDEDSFEVQCYSLPFELTNRLVRSYNVVSKTLSEIMVDLLSETNWNIGYVNANFNTMYRSLEISSATVLDAIYTCAETFLALIQWDTENKEINFYDSEQFGIYQGLNFNYGKYLKEINKTIDIDNFCTQLNIYGKDSLTINAANVSGSGYINDYSYFLYPYEESEEGNVITSSNYMSDSLCHALLEYGVLLEEKETIFSGYLTQLNLLQGDLLVLESELTDLNTDLTVIQSSLDVAQSSGTSTTQLLIDQANKQVEITAKESEITDKESEITVVETNISNLATLLSLESNFTSAQIQELGDYTIVKEVTNEYISDAQELLDWGKEQLLKINTPQILIEISSINIDQYLDEDCLLDKGKLILGSIVKIYHERFNIDIEAKIIELDFDYENSDVKLTISNIEQMNKDFDKFLQKINQSINTTTQVDMNKYKWDEANIQANYVTSVINNTWDAALRQIKAGTNESVDINNRGITLSSPSSPLESIRLMHNVIGCTLDGFNTLGVAISPRGVHANYLYGQVVASNNLLVTNTNGSFIVDGSGVTLDGMSLTITNKLPDSQISSATIWNNSLQKSTAYNGVIIDSASGIVITKYNTSNVKLADLTLNATTGIKIRKTSDDGVTWTDKFYLDSSGNIVMSGNIVAGSSITIGSGSAIFKADTNGIYLGNAVFASAPFRVTTGGYLYASNANISGIINCSDLKIGGTSVLVGNQIDDDYLNIKASTINALNITAGSVAAENITGTTISGKTIVGGSIIGASIKTATTGTRIEMDSNHCDMRFYHGSALLMSIYDGIDSMTIMPGNGTSFLNIGETGKNIHAYGNWNFHGTTTGAIAVFG